MVLRMSDAADQAALIPGHAAFTLLARSARRSF